MYVYIYIYIHVYIYIYIYIYIIIIHVHLPPPALRLARLAWAVPVLLCRRCFRAGLEKTKR